MYDYLIKNARVIDGSGAPSFHAHIALQNGQIAAVGVSDDMAAHHEIDAAGRCVTPGFIDIHRHSDLRPLTDDDGFAELAQGLTCEINGNCGLSAAPMRGSYLTQIQSYLSPITGDNAPEFATLRDYFAAAEKRAQPLHCGMLVGMGTLRACVAGFHDRPLDNEEYTALYALLEEALGSGVLGVSLGLGYAPECFYTTEELARALQPLRGSGIPIAVHMRQEGDGVVEALREMIDLARTLHTPVEISHLKAIGKRNWQRAVPQMLEMLHRAREEGIDIACDVYPYTAGSTQLIHVLPPEFQDGGTDVLTKKLQDSDARAAMRRRMETGHDFENITELVGFENVRATLLRSEENRRFEGENIAAIAQALGKDPYDALFDLLAQEQCGAGMIDVITCDADIDAILRAPFSSIISDTTRPDTGLWHPRVCGAFARCIEVYTRQRGVLTLEEAVYKMSALPAQRFGLRSKGRIAVGMDADLCIFDPTQIHECGTFAVPRQYAQGMDWVFVGGKPAIENGRRSKYNTGSILKRQ